MKTSLTIIVCLIVGLCLSACEVNVVVPQAETNTETTPAVSADAWIPDEISPEAQAFYQTLYDHQDYADRSSAIINLIQAASDEYVAYTTETIKANQVPAAWIRTANTKDADKVLLYFHGGAYVSRWVETPFAVAVAHESGIPVLSVDYRLAPDHPFPAAIEDTTSVYQWLLEQDYQPENIAIFGDSAGGGLALATVLALQDAGQPLPAALALASPWTDLTLSGDAYETLTPFEPIQTLSFLDTSAAQYAGQTKRTHPHLSPLFADYSADFPHILIQVGTREIFLTDATNLAQVVRRAEAKVTLDVWTGMWHIWHYFPNIPEGLAANREMGRFLTEHLGN